MSRNSVEEYRHGRCNIRIEYDQNAESPRTSHDNVGTMACWHRRYNLGDVRPDESPEKFIEGLASGEYWRECERLDARVDAVKDRYGYGVWRDVAEQAVDKRKERLLSADLEANIIRLPLYLYDHSGITMSTGSFSCPWDSGQVGFIYCSLEKAQHEWGTEDSKVRGWDGEVNYTLKPDGSKRTLREATIAYLEGEVEEYDNYLTGQVFGYIVEPDQGDGESCWGFTGDLDYVKKEAESVADYLNKKQEEEDVEAAEMACRDIVTV